MDELTFTTDWFTPHIPLFQKYLGPFAHRPGLRFLEIGCFEGRSSCWMLQHILTHPSSTLTCIDTFMGSHEHREATGKPIRGLEALFDQNIRAVQAEQRVRKITGMSQEKLRTLPLNHFDFIYIDGSHFAPDVLSDAVHCWPLLKQNGLLIFDDYKWTYYKDKTKNPKVAIDAFTQLYSAELSVLEKGWQLAVRKHERVTRSNCISISVVRNEADIIERWARHHCSSVDHMHIVLHECTDATEDILHALQEEGLPISLYYHKEYPHTQHAIIADLIKDLAAETQWLLPLDADEFLPVHSQRDLRSILHGTPQDTVSLLPWRTYLPPDNVELLRFRKKNEVPQYYKILIPCALVRDKNIRIQPGCHKLLIHEQEAPAHTHPTLYLAHLPVRSEPQIRNKVSEGHLRLTANPNRAPREGWHWDSIHTQLQTMSSPLSYAQLADIALSYGTEQPEDRQVIHDPIALQSKGLKSVLAGTACIPPSSPQRSLPCNH